jgi:hypothetical protein
LRALVFVLCATACSASRQYLGPNDFEHPPIPYDARIAYGPDSLQHGDLRLPQGPGPYPVAIVIHGGCWRAWHTHRHVERLAQTLTQAGWATWNLEYRAVDQPGGGWPGTLLDVGAGADHLREAAKRFPLDLNRVNTLIQLRSDSSGNGSQQSLQRSYLGSERSCAGSDQSQPEPGQTCPTTEVSH